jgi:hypothetical protein
MSNRNPNTHPYSTEKMRSRNSSKGTSRSSKKRRGPFVPTQQQIIEAQRLICSHLRKMGKFYADNVRNAAYLLRKLIGDPARQLGRTPRQSQMTLERGFMELLRAEKVVADGYGFMLAA